MLLFLLPKVMDKSTTKRVWFRAETRKKKSRWVHDFCPSRWIVRGESLAVVLNNHTELMELWKWSLEICRHRDKGTNPRSSRNADHFSIALWVNFGRVRLKEYWQFEAYPTRFLHVSSPRPAISWGIIWRLYLGIEVKPHLIYFAHGC